MAAPAKISLPTPSRRSLAASALLLVFAALAAWGNSLAGAFIFDDAPAISENPSIRQLWPPTAVLTPPADGQTVSGRPIVNLSLALNWAVGRESVRGYHVVNLAIHALAALTLFGVARRTLRSPALAARHASHATPVALCIAGLWLLHPLQTESVTYIVQRAESLAGLFLLLTLYAATRGAESPASFRWSALAVAACLLGMATKEVMFAAPLLVWLHDRTFFAGSFRAALRQRPRLYLGLAATWLLLGALAWRTGSRGSTAGFGLGISPWHYLLTQCEAIVHYLRLAFWPAPLVLDYGFTTTTSPAAVWPQAVLLLTLFVGTATAVVRGSAWGFLGAWFFLLLAPSSSFVPVATQTIAEHRMYLPLAAVVAIVVALGWRLLGRGSFFLFAAVAVVLGVLTAARNTTYRSALTIWQDTVDKHPANARAHGELALAIYRDGRAAAALPHFEEALRLTPGYTKMRYNYASALEAAGRLDDAATQLARVSAEMPTLADAPYTLGNVRRRQGRLPEALAAYELATRLRPDHALAHNNAGNLLAAEGRLPEALAHYAAAAVAQPDLPSTHYNWANVLARGGRPAEAVPHYEAALRLDPANAAIHENLGVTLAFIGRVPEGVAELEAALRIEPGRTSARTNLTAARARLTP